MFTNTYTKTVAYLQYAIVEIYTQHTIVYNAGYT